MTEARVHKALARGYIQSSAAVSESNNPLQTRVGLILTDFEPNINNQAIPLREKANIMRSALNMPLRINFDGEQFHGHSGAIPLGPIVRVYEDTDNGREVVKGEAVIWTEDHSDIATYLKEMFAEGVGTSWEIYHSDSTVDESGVEWLSDCILAGTCIVDTPAYGPNRTRILAIAETIAKKEQSIEQEAEQEHEVAAVSVPQWIRNNARRGLKWHEEGKSGDGVTAQTVREARQMASGSISRDKAKRMAAWFARHMVDLTAPSAKPGHKDYPSPGVVAHALWGGGSSTSSRRAMSWAESQSEEPKSEAMSNTTEDTIEDQNVDPVLEAESSMDEPYSGDMPGDTPGAMPENDMEDPLEEEFEALIELFYMMMNQLQTSMVGVFDNLLPEVEAYKKKKKKYMDMKPFAESFSASLQDLVQRITSLQQELSKSQAELAGVREDLNKAQLTLAEIERVKAEAERKASLIVQRKQQLSSAGVVMREAEWAEREDVILEMTDRVFEQYVRDFAREKNKSQASIHQPIPEPIFTESLITHASLAEALRKIV